MLKSGKNANKSDGENFANIIHRIMVADNINIIEAITTFCETMNVEEVDVIQVLDSHTIEKIRIEAVKLNYIRESKPRTLFDIN